jgi:hypothetical protein
MKPKKPPKKTARQKAAKKNLPPRKRGRPSKWAEPIAAEICRRLSTGEPLAAICRDAHMPHPDSVREWMKARSEFSHAITQARETGFDALAAECLTIADDTSGDVIDSDYGPRVDHGVIQRAKLKIETRLKLLSKWSPTKYGDKIEIENAGNLKFEVVIGGTDETA